MSLPILKVQNKWLKLVNGYSVNLKIQLQNVPFIYTVANSSTSTLVDMYNVHFKSKIIIKKYIIS
jgi:hypothetical protein